MNSISWADEIIVIDSYSDDNTTDIASNYGAKIFQHEYINSVKQKNWALHFCSHEWIFQIDSDEELESNVESLIRTMVNNADEDIHCFKMPRKNFVIGKWVRYGGLYPDWQYRLFRKEFGKWIDREVHSRVSVPGKVDELNTAIIHHGMPNISKQLSNLDRYTRYEADELIKINKKFSTIRWVLGPPIIFLKKYIYQQGFRDGWRGFLLAVYSAIYVFLSHAKLKEIETSKLESSPKSN